MKEMTVLFLSLLSLFGIEISVFLLVVAATVYVEAGWLPFFHFLGNGSSFRR